VDAPSAPDKPKHHTHKPVVKADDSTPDDQAETRPESTGLSKEQIAEKLGEKLDEAGVTNATHTGTSGSTNTRENPFSAFYASITQQIDETWEIPNVAAEISEAPLVHIHVEKDGRVPPESVYLITSSGNSVYDDSAVAAAKNLGYLHEPLPEGCPPDISIHFKPAR
jgi:outer membrane biosynthesis protein TonB